MRKVDTLRISVTDRCNLRCDYCMPAEGVPHIPHDEILSFEEIERVARAAVARGVKKVRVTGGEPLVRRGVVGLIERLAAIEGICAPGMAALGYGPDATPSSRRTT